MTTARVIIIGCGSIGRRHARLLARRGDVAVELCDSYAENLARSLDETGQRPTYRTFGEAIATRPDIVVIATPHDLHAEQTIRSLAAGAHVLCEKPMSDTAASARRMLAAAQASDRVFCVGFQQHFNPALQRVRDLIQAGTLGTLLHVYWHIGTYRTLLNSGSRYQAHVEGALFLDYVHQPDLLYWWLGRKPSAVSAYGVRGGALELQSDPNVVDMVLEFDKEMLAIIHLNYVQHPERAFCEVMGDKKWLSFDMKTNTLRTGVHESESESSLSFSFERDVMYEAEHQAFLDAIAGKRPPESPAEDAIVAQEIVAAALESWRQGKRVRL